MTLGIALASVSLERRLFDVSLSFDAGLVHCVIGENGAGKSTLLDVASGVLAPGAGSVCIGATPLLTLSPRVRAGRIASLGQRLVELDASVTERIAQGLAPRRGSGTLLNERALEQVLRVAEELGVSHILDRELTTLSGGERRRVEVARALVDNDAEAYVLDEPHAGVDLRHVGTVSEALARRARAGRIVIVSVHDLGTAARLGDRLVGLRAGRLVADGPPDAVLTAGALERLYGVRGVRVVRDDGRIAVLLP